ncbi:MAG: DUF1631 family protein [Pseudomonadales bacterium]
MINVQSFMLQELQRKSDEFCRDHLALFYQEFESKNEQISALASRQGSNSSLRAFVIDKRNRSLYQRFESAFLTAIHNTFADFDDFLKQRDASRPVTKSLDRVIESELALPNMIQAAERRNGHALVDLNRRLSVISQMKICAQRNPFTPLSFAHAFEQSILSLHWNMQTRILAFRLFENTVLRHLDKLYSSMNEHLSAQGILPNLQVKEGQDGKHRSELEAQQKRVANSKDETSEHVLTDTKIENVAQSSTRQVAQLVGEIAANDSAQNKHIRAIESVGRLFNDLLSHEAVTPDLKSLLTRLYTPYVRLALADDTLADNPDHPAQRLLMSLTKAVNLYQGNAAPLQRPALLLQIKKVVDQLSSHSELKSRVFAELAFRFSAELRHHDRLIHAQLDKKKRCQTGLRQLDTLRQSIRRVILSKIDLSTVQDGTPVSEFLLGTWTQYCTGLYANPDVASIEAQQALALVERILAYSAGKPLSSGKEFTELAPQLRTGILACGGESLEVRRFLQQLMHQHKHPLEQNGLVPASRTALEAVSR